MVLTVSPSIAECPFALRGRDKKSASFGQALQELRCHFCFRIVVARTRRSVG